MRIAIIIIILILVAVGGYAWKTNPAGCVKLGNDFIAVFQPPANTSAATNRTSAATNGTSAATNGTSAATDGATNSPPAPPAEPPVAAMTPQNPITIWHAPDVMPAQPNWTWTTTDGKTYQDVVVTKIDPGTVAITHSLGVAHVPIVSLPPDIQKLFNYDPAMVAALQKETKREKEHPFYPLSALADAQAAARDLRWPLAWICGSSADQGVASPAPGSDADLQQMAIDYLKSRAVVVFLNGDEDLNKVSPVVREQQFFQMDDGPIPGGHHFYGPKVVFTDPDIRKPLGRVSHTEMAAYGTNAIQETILAIENNETPSTPKAP